MLPIPDLWFRDCGVCHPPAPCKKGNNSKGFFAGFAAPNATFLGWEAGAGSGGSDPGRSARSPLHLPLQVPCTLSQPTASSESRRFASKHSKKALKASLTLGILLGMFFVAWLPFFVTNVTQVSTCGVFYVEFSKAFHFESSWVGSQIPAGLAGKPLGPKMQFPQGATARKNPSKGFWRVPSKGKRWHAWETALDQGRGGRCC